ncbi:MAG: hypothetical protein RL757_3209 [Bacteroidota bacterium]|jgi:hypothetical protein
MLLLVICASYCFGSVGWKKNHPQTEIRGRPKQQTYNPMNILPKPIVLFKAQQRFFFVLKHL